MDKGVEKNTKGKQPSLNCPTCGQPKNEAPEDIVVKCLKCGTTIVIGKISALRAKCYRCGAFTTLI